MAQAQSKSRRARSGASPGIPCLRVLGLLLLVSGFTCDGAGGPHPEPPADNQPAFMNPGSAGQARNEPEGMASGGTGAAAGPNGSAAPMQSPDQPMTGASEPNGVAPDEDAGVDEPDAGS
jgi:hypothetical protein